QVSSPAVCRPSLEDEDVRKSLFVGQRICSPRKWQDALWRSKTPGEPIQCGGCRLVTFAHTPIPVVIDAAVLKRGHRACNDAPSPPQEGGLDEPLDFLLHGWRQ